MFTAEAKDDADPYSNPNIIQTVPFPRTGNDLLITVYKVMWLK